MKPLTKAELMVNAVEWHKMHIIILKDQEDAEAKSMAQEVRHSMQERAPALNFVQDAREADAVVVILTRGLLFNQSCVEMLEYLLERKPSKADAVYIFNENFEWSLVYSQEARTGASSGLVNESITNKEALRYRKAKGDSFSSSHEHRAMVTRLLTRLMRDLNN